MAQTLEHNKTVVQVTPVEMPSCDADVEIIQKLDDEPNDVGGLSAQELKEKFDHVGGELKGFINEKLIPAIIADDLTEQARSAAEAERVANEMERVANEMERVTNEETRTEAEEERITAEGERLRAEMLRAAAEALRITEEEARQRAEADRADECAGMIATVREQADRAKFEADRAKQIAGGDFPTRQEVEKSVSDHNEAQDAHEDIREEVAKKVDKAEGTLAFALGRDAGGVYVTFEEEEDTV